MEFVTGLYREQVLAGRYFLHEHPLCATSWKLDCILDVIASQGVETEWCDQCMYGQAGGTEGPVKKPTRWMSSSTEDLAKLKTKCENKEGRCSRPGGRKHALCIGQVARMAAAYPLQLCKAIIQGCRAQLREDGRVMIGHIGISPQRKRQMEQREDPVEVGRGLRRGV